MEHQFGGAWTQEKLERLRKYLPAYTTIFRKNERARFLNTIYVDAFAGTGYSSPRGKQGSNELALFDASDVSDVQEFLKGSARIALDAEPSFDRYVFVEKDTERVQELERLKVEYRNSELNIEVVQDDARVFLPRWCSQQDWKKTRAVVFLDPYASQADWATIKAVATGQVDLWLLWPIGQVINRMLMRKELPDESWSNALTRAFGTEEWKTRFYSTPASTQISLFEDEEKEEQPVKTANFKQIEEFFIERLRTEFTYVASNPLYLYNSRNTPLYLLCFAAHNENAVKIAEHILKP